MGQRHFISVLGASFYSEFKYIYQDKTSKTIYQYCQHAILDCLKDLGVEMDKITIFSTKKACEKNWNSYTYTEDDLKEIENKKIIRPETYTKAEYKIIKTGLDEVLKNKYSVNGKLNYVIEEIPEGKNTEQLWKIFNIILEKIDCGDELYVDITNGLRSIPLQMMAVLQFAKNLKNVTVGGIFYGAYEMGKQCNSLIDDESYKKMPIFDLLPFNTILDWSSATQALLQNGSSNLLNSLCENGEKIGGKNLKECISGLVSLTNTLETSRGKVFTSQNKSDEFKCSIKYAYDKFKKYYKLCSSNSESGEMSPLLQLLNAIDNDTKFFDINNVKDLANEQEQYGNLNQGKKLERVFREYYNQNANLAVGLAAVKWAINKQLPQQGFTALEETVKTLICVTYGLNEMLDFDRQAIAANILKKLCANKNSKDKNDSKKLTLIWIMELVKDKKVSKNDSNIEAIEISENDLKNLLNYALGNGNNYSNDIDSIIKKVILNRKIKCELLLGVLRQQLEKEECTLEVYIKISNVRDANLINFEQPVFKKARELILDRIKIAYDIYDTLSEDLVEFSKDDTEQDNANKEIALSKIRNSINHFGFLSQLPNWFKKKEQKPEAYYEPLPYSYEEINDQLECKYNKLIELVIKGIKKQKDESR